MAVALSEELILEVVATNKDALKKLDQVAKAIQKNTKVAVDGSKKQEKAVEKASGTISKMASGWKSATRGIKLFDAAMKASIIVFIVQKMRELVNLMDDVAQNSVKFSLVSQAFKKSGINIDSVSKAGAGLTKKLDIMVAANRLAASGLSVTTQQMELMVAASTKAAGSIGGDMATALSDLTTGVTRGSAPILDNLGIIIKQEEAHRKYAESIGKTVGQLTTQERTIGIMQEAMLKLDAISGTLTIDSDSLGAQFISTKVAAQDMANELQGLESDSINTSASVKKLDKNVSGAGTAMFSAARGVEGFAEAMEALNNEMKKAVDPLRVIQEQALAIETDIADKAQKIRVFKKGHVLFTKKEHAENQKLIPLIEKRKKLAEDELGLLNGKIKAIKAFRREQEAPARAAAAKAKREREQRAKDRDEAQFRSSVDKEAKKTTAINNKVAAITDAFDRKQAAKKAKALRDRRAGLFDDVGGQGRFDQFKGGLFEEQANANAQELEDMAAMNDIREERVAQINAEIVGMEGLVDIYGSFSGAVQTVIANSILEGKFTAKAAKQALAARLAQIAAFNIVKAAEETALGLSAAASGNAPGAALHFAAAGKHAGVAALAGTGGALFAASVRGGGGFGDSLSNNRGRDNFAQADGTRSLNSNRSYTVNVFTNSVFTNKQELGEMMVDALGAANDAGTEIPSDSNTQEAGAGP